MRTSRSIPRCALALVLAAPLTPAVDRCAPDDPIASTEGAWLPDGRIVLLRNGGGNSDGKRQLFVMNADGGGIELLVDSLSDLYDLALSPDGRRIAFARKSGAEPQLFVLEMAGRRLTQIGVGSRPAWSPDGRHLGFLREQLVRGETRTYVYACDSDAATVTRVARGEHFSWAPDSRRVAILGGPPGPDTIRIVRAAGGSVRAVAVGRGYDGIPVWSPDGRWIAFVRQRIEAQRRTEIQLMEVRNGRRHAILRAGESWDTPAWSPDSRRLAVAGRDVSGGAAYVVGMDGRQAVRIADAPDSLWRPVWSPDGRRIALMSGALNSASLRVANGDGSATRYIAPLCWGGASPHWSPDGRKLLFGGSCDGVEELYLVHADRPGITRLTWGGWIDADPAWSPDGGRVAFARREDGQHWAIHVVERDGGSDRRVADGRVPDWAPNGSALAFEDSGDGGWSIYVVGADGGRRRALVTAPWWAADSAEARAPKWSPDGTRIAFGGGPKGTDPGVYVAAISTGDPKRLTPDDTAAGNPAWSPDGARIAYAQQRGSDCDYDCSALWIMDADGSHRSQLTKYGNFDAQPAWSPDGRRIAFARYSGNALDVFVVSADGTDLRRLTDDPAFDWAPAWSRDGQWIAFSSDRGGNASIWLVHPDGSGPRQLTGPPKGAARMLSGLRARVRAMLPSSPASRRSR